MEALVEAGRKELAAGNLERARWHFREVLSRDPQHPRALLGMSYVERQSDRAPEGGAALLNTDAEVVDLVRSKRYEDALDLLRRVALERPDDESVAKSMAHIEEHIDRRRLRALGGPAARLQWLGGNDRPVIAQGLEEQTVESLLARSSNRRRTLAELTSLQKDGLVGLQGGLTPPATESLETELNIIRGQRSSETLLLETAANDTDSDNTELESDAAATAFDDRLQMEFGTLREKAVKRAPRIDSSALVPSEKPSGGILGWVIAVLIFVGASYFVYRHL